jgi:hypothetical protein
MSNQPSFPPSVISNRPRVALSAFTVMLGDIMRNLRVDRQPRSVASPRPVHDAAAAAAGAGASAPGGGGNAVVVGAPTYSLLPESAESVVRSMGVDVGMRSVAHIADIAYLPGIGGGAAAAAGNPAAEVRSRPASFADAAKFIASHCWEYWFDHAPANRFLHLESFYIDEYEGMACLPFGGTGVNGIPFSTFVCGIIEGAMRALGYPCIAQYSAADADGLQQYQLLPLKMPTIQ